MTPPPPRIAIYHVWADRFLEQIEATLPGVAATVAPDAEVLKAVLPDADVLICTEIPPDALPLAKKLRWIQLPSAGVDGLLPVRESIPHVIVTNARGVHAELMADHAIGTIIMLQWDFPRLLREQAAKQWNREPKRALAGQTLCVIGPGAIGGEVGRRAAHFGMRVLGVRRTPGELPGFDAVYQTAQLDEVLPRADFVCMTAPANAETRHMMGERQFALMKPSAFFINISRGSLVDEPAMIAALRQGEIAGAALDVFEQEPPANDHPLWTMPNVIITPHISGLLETNAERVIAIFADNLRRYMAGEPLHNTVDLSRGY